MCIFTYTSPRLDVGVYIGRVGTQSLLVGLSVVLYIYPEFTCGCKCLYVFTYIHTEFTHVCVYILTFIHTGFTCVCVYIFLYVHRVRMCVYVFTYRDTSCVWVYTSTCIHIEFTCVCV